MSALALERFSGLAGLEAVADDWREALSRSAADPLCNSFEWNVAHARAHAEAGRDDGIFGWIGRDPDGVAACVLPLRSEPRRSALALPRVRLLADGTFDSDYLEPIAPRGREAEVWTLLLDALARERGAHVAVFGVLAADGPAAETLRTELQRRGLPWRTHSDEAAVATLPGDLEQYLAGLKKRVRSKLRQAGRRALERGAEVEWLQRPEQLDEWLTGLYDLHTRRWAALDQPGSFADPARRRFYAELFPLALSGGWLRFARLVMDGRPIAYQAGFARKGTYYQLQEGYDPELEALRPGSMLRLAAVESLIAEGLERYDFMAGMTRHKAEWGGEPRPLETLACPLPGRPRARASYALRAWLDRRHERAQ